MRERLIAFWHRQVLPVVRVSLSRLTVDGSLRWHFASARTGRAFTGYCVYRARNANYVLQMIRSAPLGSSFYLHALDEVPAELATWTKSTGVGARMLLFNSLMRDHPPAGQPVVLFDDDVSFLNGAVGAFCALADTAQLDVAQPAHARGSHSSFRVVRADPAATVRLVRFVESGPVVYLSTEALTRLTPFPDDLRMGWGVDVWWSALQAPPLRLGVVDATPVVHHGAVGVDYDNEAENMILERYLKRARLESAHELDSNLGFTWRPWQRTPKWIGNSPR